MARCSTPTGSAPARTPSWGPPRTRWSCSWWTSARTCSCPTSTARSTSSTRRPRKTGPWRWGQPRGVRPGPSRQRGRSRRSRCFLPAGRAGHGDQDGGGRREDVFLPDVVRPGVRALREPAQHAAHRGQQVQVSFGGGGKKRNFGVCRPRVDFLGESRGVPAGSA